MRKLLCSVTPLFNKEKIKNLNKIINNNLVESSDNPSGEQLKILKLSL